MMDTEHPISTVYVQNLEERVKPEPLAESLRVVFSEFGNVIDIVAKNNLKAKGQAFVVFDRPNSAHDAIEELQGFEIFGKPMRLALARTRSDKTVELTGTGDDLESHKKRRLAEKEIRASAEAANAERNSKREAAAVPESRPNKLSKTSGLKSTGAAPSTLVPDEYLPPNKTLFLQNISDGYGIEALSAIYGRFEGFREVRLVPGRQGIAFVEYDTEQGAIAAKESTSGMKMGDSAVRVTYQRQ